MKKQTYDLEERLLEYSVRIIKIVEQLPNTRAGNHVAGQLLRSGTSPYPNHGEAQAAESPKDFIHKLRISLKELREKIAVECSVLDMRFSFDVGCSMFDVRRSSFKTIPYGVNVTRERLQHLLHHKIKV
jgi:four helix bundle protein